MNMISIIIPSFNEEKYLGKLLDSIKSSKFKDFEIIVSDNNSTDNSEEIIKTMMKQDSRIKFIKNEENIELSYARFLLVKATKAVLKEGLSLFGIPTPKRM